MELTKEMREELFHCADGMYLIEEDTKTVAYVNQSISPTPAGEMVGKKCYEAFQGRTSVCPFCPEAEQIRECGAPSYSWDFYNSATHQWLWVKNRMARFNGVWYRVGNVTVTENMMELSGEAIREVAALHRLTVEYEKSQKALDYESSHDRMTGLFNRNQYTKDLETIFRECASLGVIFFDLNNLKETNDKCRHAAGDELLRRLAGVIGMVLNDDRRGYRIGGDEFVILCRGCTEEELEKCRLIVLRELDARNEGRELSCSVAVGSAWASSPDDTEGLVALADRRMYADKHAWKEQKKG